ncbi:MAG: penicillin-binding transpeptidase domain-containing protein [Candidatus Shapirobacteria bacterium]
MKVGLFLSFGILFVGFCNLSIIRHKYYYSLSRENRIFETVIPAGRGLIVDRKDRVVAKSFYQYFKMVDGNRVYDDQGDFLGYRFEGKDLAYELKRQYPYGESMSFITGYVGQVNEKEINTDKCKERLGFGSVLGRGGTEEYFDCDLRGVDGKRLIEVDAKGKYIRELGRQEPEIGEKITLSLDAYWQEKIYKMLEGKKAVVIISNPQNGEIVSMVSSPGFDPNVFSFQQDNVAINNYLDDKVDLPLLNRAVAARYHPGSVFKLTMATGGLETGVIDGNTLIEDTGVIKVGEYSYSNWLWNKSGGTDGMVNIVKALKRSNDIFFYRLGERMGLERIVTWADKFGFGKKAGVELPGEISGILPDEKWKIENKGEKWFLGNTYHLAIGQGDLSVTPLQVNQMTNVVANGGVKCKMTLIRNGKAECESLGIKKETIKLVVGGMKEACKSGGTAWPLFNFKTEIACKTGTAEVGDGSKETHAWLTAFAPVDEPQISITVVVERGGEGSDVAAPIVGDILKEWFEEPETVVPRYGTPTPGIKM